MICLLLQQTDFFSLVSQICKEFQNWQKWKYFGILNFEKVNVRIAFNTKSVPHKCSFYPQSFSFCVWHELYWPLENTWKESLLAIICLLLQQTDFFCSSSSRAIVDSIACLATIRALNVVLMSMISSLKLASGYLTHSNSMVYKKSIF